MEQPINLKAWSREHSEDFENTIGSQVIQVGNEFFVMLIRGPNDRTDFHVNQSEVFGNCIVCSLTKIKFP